MGSEYIKYGENNCGTLLGLINDLNELFNADSVDIDHVQYLMNSYKSNPAEWLKFAKFDKYKYTRNLVYGENEKYNLMILCWGEGHGSSIHDHADAHCFMKMLAGSLSEVRYEWPETEMTENEINENQTLMKEKSRNNLNTNDVCYINDSLGLHRVENLSYSDRAVSLHLYSPPFDSCNVFNQRTGHRTKSKVTFWSINGKKNKIATN